MSPSQRDESQVSTFKGLKFEAALALLLVATFLAVAYQDLFLKRTIVFSPADPSNYAVTTLDDRIKNGKSTIEASREQPLEWTCNLRKGFAYPYCSYDLLFDSKSPNRGLDLSKFHSLSVELEYEGPAELLRAQLKNFDPRYSKPGLSETSKYLNLEFSPPKPGETIKLKLADFGVADWWLAQFKIPPNLGRPQFDNITSLEILPGTDSPMGAHRFKIRKATFEGTLLSPAEFYLGLLAIWAIVIACFVCFRTVSQKREYERRREQQAIESQALRFARDAAEAASRAKSQFLANMSHELRTPLNAILGYAQLLQRHDLPRERSDQALRTIHQAGTHLLTLIKDVLDLSRIEAGKLQLEPGPCDLIACLNSIGEMMRGRAEEKDLRFNCELAGDLPRLVTVDEKRLRQILINLLGNAIKFTAHGEVSLCVSQQYGAADHAVLRFEVKDSGCGIPSDSLAAIFNPFEQVSGSERCTVGAGLGLSICRDIASLMESCIHVESGEGQGSRFWFDLALPLLSSRDEAMLPTPSTISGYAGARRTILIVDDVEANRAVLIDALSQRGFQTIEASDGREAVEATIAKRPDLVLMDLKMPVMNGFEAIRQIRATEAVAVMPIIALSASTTEDVQTESIAAGADSFLSKPVDHEELIQQIMWRLKLEWVVVPSAGCSSDDVDPLLTPPADCMAKLLGLAQAGNMRAISREAEALVALDERYGAFARKLRGLADNFQSPAVLQLIQQHVERKAA